jgi:hypothetical protein
MVLELTLPSGFGRSAKHPIRSFFGGLWRQRYVHAVRPVQLNLAVNGLNFGRLVKKFFVTHLSTMIWSGGCSSAALKRNADVRFGSKADIDNI